MFGHFSERGAGDGLPNTKLFEELFSLSLEIFQERGGGIRYLPSLLIQFLSTVCTASCRNNFFSSFFFSKAPCWWPRQRRRQRQGGEGGKKKNLVKASWRRRGKIKKMLKSFLAAVLLSASVKSCFVSRTRDFLICEIRQNTVNSHFPRFYSKLGYRTLFTYNKIFCRSYCSI